MRKALATLLAATLLITIAGPAYAVEVAAEGTVHGGIYSKEFFVSGDLDALAAASGRRVTFAGTFHNVFENDGTTPGWSNTREYLNEVWLGKATPFANVGINAPAAAIAAGTYDAKIDEWASHVEQYLDKGEGRSVIIAPLQEANGNWTFWGCDPANFKPAYRKFVDIFAARGLDATKVRWAWAPNGWTSPGCGKLADYYPGDAYVDVISISAYNFGTCVPGSNSWDSVPQVFGPWLDELRSTVNAEKPYMIAQTAAPAPAWCGGSQDAWVRDMFTYLSNDPNVVGLVWFNLDKSSVGETDWRIWNGSAATQGWRDGINFGTTSYQWPLTDWFQPGALTVSAAPGPCPDGTTCDTVAFVDSGARWHRYSEVSSAGSVSSFFFGNPGDVPFMGDWDCDGVATPGLYRQSDGFVYLRNSNTQGVADVEFFFGNPGDIPLAGDFNGNGCDTVSIYRQSEGKVYVVNALGVDGGGLGAADFGYFFGNPGDRPFVGDFDGDGIDTVGLYRVSSGFVYFRNSNSQGVADFAFFYGNPGDVIMAADWDGDGDDTVAVYRPSDDRLYINLNNAPTVADHTLFVGGFSHAVASAQG